MPKSAIAPGCIATMRCGH